MIDMAKHDQKNILMKLPPAVVKQTFLSNNLSGYANGKKVKPNKSLPEFMVRTSPIKSGRGWHLFCTVCQEMYDRVFHKCKLSIVSNPVRSPVPLRNRQHRAGSHHTITDNWVIAIEVYQEGKKRRNERVRMFLQNRLFKGCLGSVGPRSRGALPLMTGPLGGHSKAAMQLAGSTPKHINTFRRIEASLLDMIKAYVQSELGLATPQLTSLMLAAPGGIAWLLVSPLGSGTGTGLAMMKSFVTQQLVECQASLKHKTLSTVDETICTLKICLALCINDVDFFEEDGKTDVMVKFARQAMDWLDAYRSRNKISNKARSNRQVNVRELIASGRFYDWRTISKLAASNLKFADDLFVRLTNNEFQDEKDDDDAIEACLIIWTIGFEQLSKPNRPQWLLEMLVGDILMPSLQSLSREAQTSQECRTFFERGLSCLEILGGIFIASLAQDAVMYRTSRYKTEGTYGIDILVVTPEIGQLIVKQTELLVFRIAPKKGRTQTMKSHIFQTINGCRPPLCKWLRISMGSQASCPRRLGQFFHSRPLENGYGRWLTENELTYTSIRRMYVTHIMSSEGDPTLSADIRRGLPFFMKHSRATSLKFYDAWCQQSMEATHQERYTAELRLHLSDQQDPEVELGCDQILDLRECNLDTQA